MATSAGRHCVAGLTTAERAWIRRELGPHFGTAVNLAEGFILRKWKTGPERGETKLPPPVRTMVERKLLEVRAVGQGARAFFTAEGLKELRNLVGDKRAMNPAQFAHLYGQLGLPCPAPGPVRKREEDSGA